MASQSPYNQGAEDNSPKVDGGMAWPIDGQSAASHNVSSVRIHQAGEELFGQGSFPHGVYFINSGYVKLSSVDSDGREIIVGLLSTRSMVGATAVILQRPYRLSASTITTCELSYISSDLFISLLKRDSRFSWLVQVEQSRETYERVTHIAQLGCSSARQRLEELFWKFASTITLGEGQKETRIALPLKQWEVAQLLAITPEHLNRVVKQMQREGILQWKKGVVVIIDLQSLRHSTNL